ncbi:type VII secretion protein EsxS [Mycobacterium koreense]|uniref:Type VII secretion protein EsxS n=1 Tax=Mycolicibacillus koreensis TaxID=1069220 RepID=A0A7I7SGM4_9MYCO|nr:type VII secretion protein EsxS [Mycolicibacillus koreensis]MCV7247082.1 type VII secretion protein EsxS [Mycolicibacillus koreensis]ODR09895.1 type VII secretion protein EsxS [Mycolicibacillus koreensis]OSC31892.1 type VII secretion protein EsxS [Mycolicibacillus koreensis]BBY55968.1 PE family protein [Mycolicibacillus koreensis]
MGLLDANIPALLTAESAFGTKTTLMRSTLAQAEQSALASQAFHQGESSVAFQGAHMRFIEVASKVNALLDIAQANIGEAGTTYVSSDAAAAATYNPSL